jgi:hypothetical protein
MACRSMTVDFVARAPAVEEATGIRDRLLEELGAGISADDRPTDDGTRGTGGKCCLYLDQSGAHRPVGLTDQEWARLARTFALSAT